MIPRTAHFVWYGKSFPWVYGLALWSAVSRGGFERVVLHHEDDIIASPGWELAKAVPGVESRRLVPQEVLESAGPSGPGLVDLYRRLSKPAARSNMVRAAILAREGGVYLDTDVLTVGSFAPLLKVGMFCGSERIALPAGLTRTRHPGRWAVAVARLAARDALRRLPGGWLHFRKIEQFYPAVVNNAVLGARAGHPLVMEMLERMVRMPASEQIVRFALGTHLLEDAVAAYSGDDLVVHPPHKFYPLPPEISEHWFRRCRAGSSADAIWGDAVCVHWYASVRTATVVPKIDLDYVRKMAGVQLFSELALRLLNDTGPAAVGAAA